MTDRIGGTKPTPAPAPKPTPTPAPKTAPIQERAARIEGDSTTLSADTSQIVNEGLNSEPVSRFGQGVGIQTFAQGKAGALAGLTKGTRFGQISRFLDGDGKTIGHAVGRLIGAARKTFPQVFGRHSGSAIKATTTILPKAAKLLHVVGKAAPVLNVIVAGIDTFKAATERDPAKQRAAWTNAGISIGGTAMAVGAVVIGATPVGWALGAGAAAFAAFQLVDTFATNGKMTQWVGDKAVAAWEGTKNAASAVAGGAKRAWNALTSL